MMLHFYQITLIFFLLSSLVAGQTASNVFFTSGTGFHSLPTEVAIPPIAEMIGPVSAFSEFVEMKGTKTMWIHPVSSEIQRTTTASVSRYPPQSTGLSVARSNISISDGENVLTSPPFRLFLENKYQETKPCIHSRAMLRPQELNLLCGFNEFLNLAKYWSMIKTFSEFSDSELPSRPLDSQLLEKNFRTALVEVGRTSDIGYLSPASFYFLWISWNMLLVNGVLPPVLRIPVRNPKSSPSQELLCEPGNSTVNGEIFQIAVDNMCKANMYNTGKNTVFKTTVKEIDPTETSNSNISFFFQAYSVACPWTCLDLYALFISDKTCYNDYMTTFGSLEEPCGIAGFLITPIIGDQGSTTATEVLTTISEHPIPTARLRI